MVSHCETESKREDYVMQLGKYIEVDIYGKCGLPKCEKGDKACSSIKEASIKAHDK